MGTSPEQLRHHAERSAEAGRHATAIICREAAEEIERLRAVISDRGGIVGPNGLIWWPVRDGAPERIPGKIKKYK